MFAAVIALHHALISKYLLRPDYWFVMPLLFRKENTYTQINRIMNLCSFSAFMELIAFFNRLIFIFWLNVHAFSKDLFDFHSSVFNANWLTFWQVTSSSVRLVSSASRELRNEWKAPTGYSVNVATANASQVTFEFFHFICLMPNLLCDLGFLVCVFWIGTLNEVFSFCIWQ